MGSTDEALPATDELTDDDAMPAFEVPETPEAVDEGAVDAPVEGEVDPEVAAIVAAAMPFDFDADEPEAAVTAETKTDDTEAAVTEEPEADEPEAAVTEEPEADEPEADVTDETEADDTDGPQLDLPSAHDEDLNARIDAHIAAMHERIDSIIGGLRSA